MQYGNVIMEHHQPAPSFLVQLLHSVPHINITLHRVNDTFNPNSTVYTETRRLGVAFTLFERTAERVEVLMVGLAFCLV
uniref:Protein tweety homolog n=1 Tax=Anopheles coluzzii TaxID=1518534 RepID=A0A8W7PTB5_ANOCL